MYGLNKYMIDINIETLAGTTFSLKVSPLESVQSVKAKIQRHEGIPISHQNLVWQSSELDDKMSLTDYNIPDGATIRMVLALRGGPINTRRMTTEDALIRDVSDLMEIQEDSNLWNNNDSSSRSVNKHVTVLFFRDGDHLNFLRFIDRGDGQSPISGAMSAASMYVPYDETDHDAGADLQKSKKSTKLASKRKKSANNENQRTREKMMEIKNRMNQLKKNNEPPTQTTTDNHNDKEKNSDKILEENLEKIKNSKSKKSNVNNSQNLKIKKFNINSSNQSHTNKYVYFEEYPNGEYEEDDEEGEEEEEGEDYTDEDEHYDDEYLEDDEYDEEDEDDQDEYDRDEDEEEDEDEEDDISKFNQEQYYANLSQSCENVNNIETEYETGDRVIAGDEDENYDEDDNELLLNKSEFLINEDHQTTNSPSSGMAGADLMTIMMMTVNSDQFSLNGAPSSLATTALPTVLTPLYSTDNENFLVANSGSAGSKTKYLKDLSSSKKNNFDGTLSSKIEYVKNRKKVASKVPKTENEDLAEETDAAKLEQNANTELESKTRQKQRRRKRQVLKDQNVQTDQVDEQDAAEENKTSDSNRRNRRRYELRAELHQITSFSPTTILVKTVSLNNNGSRRKTKEGSQRQRVVKQSVSQLTTETGSLNIDKENSVISNTESLTLQNEQLNSVLGIQNHNKIETITESPLPSSSNQQSVLNSSLRKSSAAIINSNSRMISSSQKRVSFTVSMNEDQQQTFSNLNSSETSINKLTNVTRPIIKSKSPVSFSSTQANTSGSLLDDTIYHQQQQQQQNKMSQQQQQYKPFLLTNYKQKPPPKLDALYTHQDTGVASSISHSIQLYRQNTNLENRLEKQIDTISEGLSKNHLNPIVNSDGVSNYSSKIQQSYINKRNQAESFATPTATPAVTSNRLDVLKNNLGSASILKPYQHQMLNNYSSNLNDKATHSIEISRIYSGSHSKINKPFSISANDLTQSTKTLKLPPVLNNNESSILIAGSANNLNSIGLSDAIAKKKVNDMRRYCDFCKKKTGLASSYICRCGNNYCTQHRNAESHNCTFDYKTEGRKLIELNNPLFAAPKLPKI